MIIVGRLCHTSRCDAWDRRTDRRVTLRANVDATAQPVADVRDASGYDGYVIGSAVYAMHWLGDAKSFIRRNRVILRERPVWLFSRVAERRPAEADKAAPREAASGLRTSAPGTIGSSRGRGTRPHRRSACSSG